MRHWNLTSLQFEALIFAQNRDRVPYPLWNDHAAADLDDLRRKRVDAVQSLVPLVDEDLVTAAGLLVQHEIRILLHGHTVEPATEHRGYACLSTHVASVAVQKADPEPARSGDVTLTLCKPSEVAALLVGNLPDRPGGRVHKINAPRAELAMEPPTYTGLQRPPTLQERYDEFCRTPYSAWGEITVYPGPFIDNRVLDDRAGFFWVDFPDDGRYFYRNDDYIKALAMPRDEFIAAIDRFARRIRDRVREPRENDFAR